MELIWNITIATMDFVKRQRMLFVKLDRGVWSLLNNKQQIYDQLNLHTTSYTIKKNNYD